MSEVSKEVRIESLTNVAEQNAALMTELCNDVKMSLEKKIKLWRPLVMNATQIRSEQRRTLSDLVRLGRKVNGQLDSLTFESREEAQSE